MKNFVLLAALAFGGYYFYTHPRVETVLQPVAVAAPAPIPFAPAPKQYFHSPLDASAMSTGMSTGTGYYSSDPNSRFSNYGGYYSSFQAAGGYPVYTGTTNNTAIFNNYGGRSATTSAPVSSGSSYFAGRVPLAGGTRANSVNYQRKTSSQTTTNY